MRQSWREKLTSTQQGLMLYQQECLIQGVTDLICEILDDKNISRKELGIRIGRSEGYVHRLLDGRIKIDLRMLSDILTALHCSVDFLYSDLHFEKQGEKI